MAEYAEYVYDGVISRLLRGWKPNYFMGELKHEWWHEPSGAIETMDDDQFRIVERVEEEIRRQIALDLDID